MRLDKNNQYNTYLKKKKKSDVTFKENLNTQKMKYNLTKDAIKHLIEGSK